MPGLWFASVRKENFHKRQGYEIMATLRFGHARAKDHGAGRGESLVVAVALMSGRTTPSRRTATSCFGGA